MQEMKLFEGAYDGDVEGVRNVLPTGVPVDATYPVRLLPSAHTSVNIFHLKC